MGNTETTRTIDIVSHWGDKEREKYLSTPRIDSVEIRANKRSDLTSIGLCRPIKGRLEAQITLRSLSDK